MEYSTSEPLLVNLTALGTRPTGAGAYASFCAGVVRETFDTRSVTSPAWISRLPRPLNAVGYALHSAAAFRRLGGVVYNPTYRVVPGRPDQIVTIFDLIPLEHPGQHPLQTRYFNAVLPPVLTSCRAMITLTDTVADRIAARFAVERDRIHVVPPGVDTDVFTPVSPGAEDPPFLLVAGASLPHKNVESIIANADVWSSRYRLVITGVHPKYQRTLRALVQGAGIGERVSFERYVSPERMLHLYRQCACLLYPSLSEGFGLPPLEALACGRPAIVSDIDVTREVCGDAAIYVTPSSPRSWKTAFTELEDLETMADRMAAARERLGVYSWEHTREALTAAVAKVLGR